jgi:hypothetical protein
MALGACGFSPTTADHPTVDGGAMPADASIDALTPVTCGDLTCDPHATCSGSPAACTCATGWTGDGMTCSDVNECLVGNGGCPAACENTSGSFVCYAAASCAELAQYVPNVGNAEYTLYLGGDPTKPWTAYCAATADGLLEYLSVTGSNFSQYTAGGASTGSNVTTTFTKVRILPTQMMIDISDRTFATSQGTLNHSGSGTMVTSMPYAVAMDCKADDSATGAASIDLTATHFAITGAAAFQGGGSAYGGATAMSSNNQKATLTGGGYCGWNAPVNAPSNPFNKNVTSTNGAILPLVYF